MSNWIKLDRNVVKHWIFKDDWKFKCWVDLLVLANYSDNKVVIKGMLLTCKRGELLYSLDSLSLRWNSNKSKVRRFLKLLESDSMIVLKSEQVTTRITICNYESYQGERNADETQMTRKRNADETQMTPIKESKEKKESKEEKRINIDNKESITPKNKFSEEIINFYDHILKFFDSEFIPQNESQKNKWLDCIDKLIRLDNLNFDEILQIVKNARNDEFWSGNVRTLLKLRMKNKEGIIYWQVLKKLTTKKQNNGAETRTEHQERGKREFVQRFMDSLELDGNI